MVLIEILLIFSVVAIAVMMMRSGRPQREPDVNEDEISALKQRIRTLEAIITDRDRNLRNEIDGLG